jgi:HEPN domain-containing protein
MNKDDIDFIKQWFEKADHDIIAAHRLIEITPVILDNACFHCQQAAEKYLKAYLLYKRHRIKKIHFVSQLQVSCAEFDKEFAIIDLKNLDLFAVDARYPDDSIVPTLDEAKEYLRIAEDIKELVRKKVIFT